MIHVDDALWFLMEKDPGLTPYSGEIRMHMDRYNDRRWHLAGNNSLADFANGYNYLAFTGQRPAGSSGNGCRGRTPPG